MSLKEYVVLKEAEFFGKWWHPLRDRSSRSATSSSSGAVMCCCGTACSPIAVAHTVPAPSTATSGWGLRIGVLETGSNVTDSSRVNSQYWRSAEYVEGPNSGDHRRRPVPSGGWPTTQSRSPSVRRPALDRATRWSQRGGLKDGEVVEYSVGSGAVEDHRWGAGQKRLIGRHVSAQGRPYGRGAVQIDPNQARRSERAGARITLT